MTFNLQRFQCAMQLQFYLILAIDAISFFIIVFYQPEHHFTYTTLAIQYKCGTVMHEKDDLRYDTNINKMTIMS